MKGDQMGILAAYPTQRELPLSNQTRFRWPEATKSAEFQNGAIQFERHDWTLFRTVATLSQKAGVPQKRLRGLVLKELVDNALDAGAGFVGVGPLDHKDRYFVQDDGPGLDGSPSAVSKDMLVEQFQVFASEVLVHPVHELVSR